MKILSIDFHISVVADVKDILEKQGHTVDVWSLSGHRHIMGYEKGYAPFTREEFVSKINNIVWIKRVRKELKKVIKDYDAVLVTYPPSMVLLYDGLDIPVICVVPIRYEYPFFRDGQGHLRWYINSVISRGQKEGWLHAYANNVYDQFYLREEGIHCPVIPSLCDYTGAKYNPPKEFKGLYTSRHDIEELDRNGWTRKEREFKSGSGYSWQDIANYSCVLHVPYNYSTMTMYELSAQGVPQIFPTERILYDLVEKGLALKDHSWKTTFNIHDDTLENDSNLRRHIYHADFYENIPIKEGDPDRITHKSYYGSLNDDIESILRTVDFEQESKCFEYKKQFVYKKWEEICQKFA